MVVSGNGYIVRLADSKEIMGLFVARKRVEK